jgi:aminopeptidase N
MLQAYIGAYQYKSVTTEDFVSFFQNFVSKDLGKPEKIKNIDFHKWIYETGPTPVKFDDNLVEDI